MALVALAISPVPPSLPTKQLRQGGYPSYAIGLFVVEAVLAIVFIPPAIAVLGTIFRIDVHTRITAVDRIVLRAVLAPLVVGMVAGWFAPKAAHRVAGLSR